MRGFRHSRISLARGAAVAAVLFTSLALAQSAAPPPQFASVPDNAKFAPFVFDVVSIKPAESATDRPGAMRWQFVPDGFSANRVTVQWMVATAYDATTDNISGGPSWFANDEYAMQAKFAPEVADALNKLSPADVDMARAHAFRIFLAQRANLAVHVTQKAVDGYAMVVGKKSSALKPAANPNQPGNVSFSIYGETFSIVGKSATISMLFGPLSGPGRAPIMDKTGLTGVYDFDVRYDIDLSTDASGQQPAPGVFSGPAARSRNAIAETLETQLGLKLVPAHVMVNAVHVEHVDRPSAN
jgi:uncharacterized protein (TIGR03435 family)